MAGLSEYHDVMIRKTCSSFLTVIAVLGIGSAALLGPAAAQDKAKPAAGKPSSGKTDSKTESKTKPDAKKPEAAKPAAAQPGKPSPLAQFGAWAAYAAGSGKTKTCYALGQPSERKPELNRDPAYLFVSTRPGEAVRNEVSFVMGFEVKPDVTVVAQVGTANFDLIAKGANLWVKNAASEGQFVEALKKGSKLTLKAPSKKGNLTTDTYVLQGLAQALDRVQKECP